jgi:cation diffusion facilitator CzcD-associated flavoprotein CzcO
MQTKHYDVIIIGAGISGIGVACHMSKRCPDKNFAIIERRNSMGGTWDLFKYPGIRSDSDVHTFGYSFRPWKGKKVLADGPSIKQYIIDTAREYGVDQRIQYGLKITGASLSSADRTWYLEALEEKTGITREFTANFIVHGTGYYNYDQGYKPEFPGESAFKGRIIHPQHWPENFDYSGKKVVVIGSGATAMTLLPAMAEKAGHITMLQRSPGYIVSVASEDIMSKGLNGFLPRNIAYQMGRVRNVFLQRLMFWLSRQRPSVVRRFLLKAVKDQVGPDVEMKHFSPDYKPWDQRLCVVPDGDLFKVVREGRASIVTEHIDRFTEKGILLKNGQELEADIIVTATGLDVRMGGGAIFNVDGESIRLGDKLTYKGVLIEDLPNAAVIFGYINASWTLKVDIASKYICRLLNLMEARGYDMVVPRDQEGCKSNESIMALNSGYLSRAKGRLPRQGTKGPWRISNNYLTDILVMGYAPIKDRILEFTRKGERKKRYSK